MSANLHVLPVPLSRQPVSLRAVERALADLRRGRPVVIAAGGGMASVVLAAEAATPESLRALSDISFGDPD